LYYDIQKAFQKNMANRNPKNSTAKYIGKFLELKENSLHLTNTKAINQMLKQQRVVIENVSPQLQCGSYFIKRVVGETVKVYADLVPDGHDVIQAEVLYKHESEKPPQIICCRPG
jgi:hypothetical protein